MEIVTVTHVAAETLPAWLGPFDSPVPRSAYSLLQQTFDLRLLQG